MERNKIYFASDFHLGIPDYNSSLEREKKIVRWLESIENDAVKIFLVGDLFDFWFEYKYVVPRGHVRLLGKIAQLKDKGIDVQIFTGNHDLWMYVGHGDGIGPGDYGFKFMKRIFKSRLAQILYGFLHPYIAFKIARYFSYNSRRMNEEEKFMGEDKEWQIIFAKEVLQKEHFDYFLFGHRHIVLDIPIGERSTFINLGDWMIHFTYAEFDGNTCKIKYFEK